MENSYSVITLRDALVALEILAGMLYVFFLFFYHDGAWKSGKIRASKSDALMKQRESQADSELAEIRSFLGEHLPKKEFNSKSFDYFQAKIANAINYAIGRHDWYETQRANIFKTSVTFLAVILTALAVISRFENLNSNTVYNIAIFTSLSAYTILALARMVFLYNVELDADRPYRLISDIRTWFFRYNLTDISPRYGGDRDPLREAEKVLSERERYFQRVNETLPLELSIREDIEQLFILHVLQRYKSESLFKMRWTLIYFSIAALGHWMVFFTVNAWA